MKDTGGAGECSVILNYHSAAAGQIPITRERGAAWISYLALETIYSRPED